MRELEANKTGLVEAKATIEQLNKSLAQGNRLTICQFIFFVASLVGVLWIGIGLIDRRIDDLNRNVNTRFEDMNRRMDDMSKQMTELRQILLEQQKKP